MGLVGAVRGAWRKNEAEIRGLFNGALPDFVTAARPRDALGGVPVFCYHLVEAASFEADLTFLAENGFQTLRGKDLVAHLRGERDLPDRSVLLTFDDGPRNFYDVAFPLLARFQARVTAFIAPGLHADQSVEQDIEARPMTWQEISRIHQSGLVEFQSHTLESRFVPNWPMPAALAGCKLSVEAPRRGAPLNLREDLGRSCGLLQARLPGLTVNQLAFPMYLGTAEAIADARAVGIEACYWGLQPGRALNRRGDSPFHISRMSDEFLRRLPGRGRISVGELLRIRMHRIRSARAWRHRHGG